MAGPVAVASIAGGGKQIAASREERKPKRRQVESMRIRRGENGGHVVEHDYKHSSDMPFEQPTQHVFGKDDGDKLLDHIRRHAHVQTKKHEGKGEHGKPSHEHGKKKEPIVAKKAGGPEAAATKKAAAPPAVTPQSPMDKAADDDEDEDDGA